MNNYELLMEYNKILKLEVEKLNHYKTLYNVLKDREDKAIELLKLAQESGLISISTLMKILKGEEDE